MIALVVAVPELRVTTLTGEKLEGELRELDADGLVIESEGNRQQFAWPALLEVRPLTAVQPTGALATSATAELTDGTIIPLSDFRAVGGNATLTFDRAVFRESATDTSANLGRLEIPVEKLTAVHLLPPSDDVRRQWHEIRSLALPSDVLIVRKQGGIAVDFLEGVVGDVSDERIEFELDGDPLRVRRGKVDGFILFRRAPGDLAAAQCRVRGLSGLDAPAQRVVWRENVLQITTRGGVVLHWPWSDIQAIDFSTGKLVYLSDLTPVMASWEPKIALPNGVTAVEQFNRPRMDESFAGSKLGLLWPGGEGASAARSVTRKYEKGVAVRSRSILLFDIPAGFRRFVVMAGIDPAMQRLGHVRLRVEIDGASAFDEEIRGGQTPRALDLDVVGRRQLRIEVDFGDQSDWGDSLHLVEARFTK